jgi:cytochrome c peroxidase
VFKTAAFTDAQILDAMRNELFRVITLGITGFDSPVALHSIPEAAASLAGLQETIHLYGKSPVAGQAAQFGEATRLLGAAIAYLNQHKDFNSFDRLEFITRFANPLTANITGLRQVTGLPDSGQLKAVSPVARTLFDKHAFDVNYFTPDHQSYQTPERVELGKMLFFEPILSGNGSRSCASCH